MRRIAFACLSLGVATTACGSAAPPAPAAAPRPEPMVASDAPAKPSSSGPGLDAFPIEMNRLPTVVLPEPLDDDLAPEDSIGQIVAHDVFFDRDVAFAFGAANGPPVLKARGFVWGTIRVAKRWAVMVPSEDGTMIAGGVDLRYLRGKHAVRWEGLRRYEEGGRTQYDYEISDGWVDVDEEHVFLVHRTIARVATIVEDSLYAFRQCESKACEKPSIALVAPKVFRINALVGPPPESSSRIVLAPTRGQAESLFLTGIEGGAPLRIEIIQATLETEPVVTAFRKREI